MERGKESDGARQGAWQTNEPPDPLRQTAQQVTQQAGEAAEQAVEGARQMVTSGLSGGKEWVTGNLEAISSGLRQAREGMDESGHGVASTVLERVAGTVENATAYLQDSDLDDLRWDLESFARRQPGAFLAGTFALGLLSARFLKSSRLRSQRLAPAGYLPGAAYGSPPRYPPYPASSSLARPEMGGYGTQAEATSMLQGLDPLGAAEMRARWTETEPAAPTPGATGTARAAGQDSTQGVTSTGENLPGSIAPTME